MAYTMTTQNAFYVIHKIEVAITSKKHTYSESFP